MCHQTTYTHSCTHKIKTPRLLCSLASLPSILHSVTKAKVPLLYPCPTCAVRLGQPITYPYQVPYQNPIPVSVPAPPPAQRVVYQAAPGVIYQPPQPQPVQQIPGPGSYGSPLPVPQNSTRETRLEFSSGAWRPVVHYSFPSSTPPPVTIPQAVPVQVKVQAAGRPANLSSNQGWSRVHGVDLGPGPPGPQPSGNGGPFSLVGGDNGNLGWGAPVFQPSTPQAQGAAQASSSSSSTPSPQAAQQPQNSTSAPPNHAPPQAQTPAQIPSAGTPPNILAAAAVQAPLPPQTPHIQTPQPQPQTQYQTQAQSQPSPQHPQTSSSSTVPAQPPAGQQTPNEAARNARAESLLGMSSSVLARLTAANTDANANGGVGGGGGGRPASA
ncbi:hypothetical protein DL98DRAFT_570569 [Cadophora sp. DSE1049]|nr:hypothetical protein DL98DRAFT_570569 [Cadophora sp. DSE1049]